jgi:hypothetical protein
MPDRYVVRELEGFLMGTGGTPGLSVIVLDSRVNYRVVREFQSETADRTGRIGRPNLTRAETRARIRRAGADLAARLNEATP